MLVCVERGKPENLKKNLRSKRRTNDKVKNPAYGAGPDWNPGYIGETRALSTLRHLLISAILYLQLRVQFFAAIVACYTVN